MDITTRRRAPDDPRAEIIEKALEVAAELGASGFTLDAVAATPVEHRVVAMTGDLARAWDRVATDAMTPPGK